MTTGDESTAEFDSESLAKGWDALANRVPTKRLTIDWAARTDIGRKRDNNEDKFDFFLPDSPPMLALRGRLWAVADGMGGHEAGQIASEAALKALVRAYFASSDDESTEGALQTALNHGNALIFEATKQLAGQKTMGTTIVVAAVRDDQLTVAHIGDSRAYLLRQNEPIRQLTTDHSWVEEQVSRGGLTREQAESSPYRNIITRSVGMAASVDASFVTETLQNGDTVLLCSDGLSGYISDETIERLLKDRNMSQAVLDLIDAANDSGGGDNITALAFTVKSIDDEDGTTP